MAWPLLSAIRYTTDPGSTDLTGGRSNVIVLCFSNSTTAPTYNGIIFIDEFGSLQGLRMWRLFNVPTGSNNFTIGGTGVDARVYVFGGMNTASPYDVIANGVNNNAQSLTITPGVDNGILMNLFTTSSTGVITATSGQSNILNFGAGDFWETNTQASLGKGNISTVSFTTGNIKPFQLVSISLKPFINNLSVSSSNAQNRSAIPKYQVNFLVSQSVRTGISASRITVWLGAFKYYALMFTASVSNAASRLATFIGIAKSGWHPQTKDSSIWTTETKNISHSTINFP